MAKTRYTRKHLANLQKKAKTMRKTRKMVSTRRKYKKTLLKPSNVANIVMSHSEARPTRRSAMKARTIIANIKHNEKESRRIQKETRELRDEEKRKKFMKRNASMYNNLSALFGKIHI